MPAGIVKRTFLPKVVKQKMNNIVGSAAQRRDMKCPFPIKPTTKVERADYMMIEQSVLENERRGDFIRVYPTDLHMHQYRNFFEEERRNDNVLHNYIFNNKYKNMVIMTETHSWSSINNDHRRKNLQRNPTREKRAGAR